MGHNQVFNFGDYYLSIKCFKIHAYKKSRVLIIKTKMVVSEFFLFFWFAFFLLHHIILKTFLSVIMDKSFGSRYFMLQQQDCIF